MFNGQLPAADHQGQISPHSLLPVRHKVKIFPGLESRKERSAPFHKGLIGKKGPLIVPMGVTLVIEPDRGFMLPELRPDIEQRRMLPIGAACQQVIQAAGLFELLIVQRQIFRVDTLFIGSNHEDISSAPFFQPGLLPGQDLPEPLFFLCRKALPAFEIFKNLVSGEKKPAVPAFNYQRESAGTESFFHFLVIPMNQPFP